METQLRRYRIAEGKLSEFVAEWRSGVVPLREAAGFVFLGAWSVPRTSEFVWIIGYDGPEGLEAADDAYYESEARQSLDPSPSRHVEEVSHEAAHGEL